MTQVQSVGWPAPTDDTGDGLSGTIGDVAFWNTMRDAINSLVHSATNPTVTPANIIDEVVLARGSLGSLNTRLSVSLNNDGTLKAQASLVATADYQMGFPTQWPLVRNGEMWLWSAGASAMPDNWISSGGGMLPTRAGPGEGDTTTLKAGKFCLKTTNNLAAATIKQNVLTASEFTNVSSLKGKKVVFGGWIQTTSINQVRLVIDDGVAVTTGAYNTTTGAPEFVTVSAVISGSATKLDVYFQYNNPSITSYLGGVIGGLSNILPSYYLPVIEPPAWKNQLKWQQGNNVFSSIATAMGIISSYVGAKVGTATGTGEQTLLSFTIPKGTLDQNGKYVVVEMFGSTAANANTKTLRVKFDGTTQSNDSGAFNANDWWSRMTITRLSATTARIACTLQRLTTQNIVVTDSYTLAAAATFDANDVIVSFTGQDATSSANDITISGFTVLLAG